MQGNPWDNSDCSRESCFSCESAAKSEKNMYKNCFKRSVVYETWCETCRKNGSTDDREVNVESDPNETIGDDTTEVDENK